MDNNRKDMKDVEDIVNRIEELGFIYEDFYYNEMYKVLKYRRKQTDFDLLIHFCYNKEVTVKLIFKNKRITFVKNLLLELPIDFENIINQIINEYDN